MKRIFFRIAKPSAFKKAKGISKIKLQRRRRILDAIRFINQWEDMPLDFIYSSICERLKMPENADTRNFIHKLIHPNVDIDEMASQLP